MSVIAKKRIEFIDLAKGVCIILVIIGHCGVNIPIPGFAMMQMPLFFILSGLFFKDYGRFAELLVRRLNTILVPFIFFYIIAYIPYYIFKYYSPELIQTSSKGILDVFNNRQFFNGPLWFLLALFWDNLIFCVININIRNEWTRGLVILIVGIIGITLGIYKIFLPCFVDVALTALPFFYFGYLINKGNYLSRTRFDKYNILIFILGYFVLFCIVKFCNDPRISFHYNVIEGNPLWVYVGTACCVISVLALCKMIKHLPIISFCGRYSIILLCLHHMIYRPLLLVCGLIGLHGQTASWFTAIVTIALCIAMIPICVKFIPWFVAQKELLKIKAPSKVSDNENVTNGGGVIVRLQLCYA